MTVNFSISSTATLGATIGGKVKVVSDEYNPSVGESLYRTWGSNNINETLAGNMFWAGYTGTTSPGVYTGTARNEGTNVFTAWATSATNPTGAYTTANEPVNTNNAIWGISGTGYGPLLQSVVTTPPTISLPQTNNNINNRRVWEIKTGIFLNSATTIYTCVTSPDDSAYIMIDGTSVVSTNSYTAGTLVNTGTALSAGYHQIVYRILNRNTDGVGGEASAGGFGALGIGTSSAGCTSANYVTLSSVQPAANITIVAAAAIITGFKSVKLRPMQIVVGSITVGDTLNYTSSTSMLAAPLTSPIFRSQIYFQREFLSPRQVRKLFWFQAAEPVLLPIPDTPEASEL